MAKKKSKAASAAARALGRSSWSKAGKARAARLTPEQRSEIARAASRKRWGTAPGGADVHTDAAPVSPEIRPQTIVDRVWIVVDWEDYYASRIDHFMGVFASREALLAAHPEAVLRMNPRGLDADGVPQGYERPAGDMRTRGTDYWPEVVT